MRQVVKDYYTGFEGYPEITFVRRRPDGDLLFTLWDGYFDDIMMAIKPDSEGWTSLALVYHLDEGWYDDPDWLIPDPAAALAQLRGVDPSALRDESRKILEELLVFLEEGVAAGETLRIEYF